MTMCNVSGDRPHPAHGRTWTHQVVWFPLDLLDVCLCYHLCPDPLRAPLQQEEGHPEKGRHKLLIGLQLGVFLIVLSTVIKRNTYIISSSKWYLKGEYRSRFEAS